MEKILIIDDDKLTLKVIDDILQRLGYHTVLAESGESGLSLIPSVKPDLVITDFQMPGMDGIAVLSEIIKMNTGIPVILLTGYGDVALTIKSIQAGAFDYLEKPIDPVQLKNAVHLAIHSVKISRGLNRVKFENSSRETMIDNNVLIGKTPAMKEIFKNIGRISLSKVNVLIKGESGTGKELIAKLIHSSGVTSDQPMVTINCSALSESLLESEFFGHLKGSHPGALHDKQGKFELAGEGSIFLDEISELSLNTQIKLLRVIQEQEFERVGGDKTIPMRARIITATNKNLEALVREGKFREELYLRLKVFTIDLPPLRERKDDIRDLVVFFLFKLNRRFNRNVVKIGDGVIDLLKSQRWTGNVRELENTILQAIVMSKNDVLEIDNIILNPTPSETAVVVPEFFRFRTIAELEKYHIQRILDETKWNKLEASRILDITRPTLNAKIEKYSLRRP